MDELTITKTIDLAAPVGLVWEAVATADGLASWFPDRAELDPVAGGSGALVWDAYGRFHIVVEEVDEPHVIAYRWAGDVDDPQFQGGSTVMRFTLQAIPGGTRLTVVETGFESFSNAQKAFEGNTQGWDEELGELADLLGRL